MGKIIKRELKNNFFNKQKVNGEFKIEFANDNFGPYKYKFQREDCYFQDSLGDRGTKIFPLKLKRYNNTEIFLENDDIIIAIGERASLTHESKTFVDIINLATEKKYRIFTYEISLIYNDENKIIINAKVDKDFTTFELDINTLEKLSEKKETLYAFFKVIYNKDNGNWSILEFVPEEKNIEYYDEKYYKKGYFKLRNSNISGYPVSFERENFIVETRNKKLDIWGLSII